MGHVHSIGTAAANATGGGDGGGATRPSTASGPVAALTLPTRPPPLSEDALPGPATTLTQSLAADQAAELREALRRLVEVLAVVNPPPLAVVNPPPPAADGGDDKAATVAAADAEGSADDGLMGEAEPREGALEKTGEFVPASPVTVALTDSSVDRAAALLLLEPFNELHLAGYRLSDAALMAPNSVQVPSFLVVLRQHTCLRLLDLGFNLLTPSIIAPLLHALQDLPALVVLKLSGNALGTTTATTTTSAAAGNVSDAADADSALDWDLTSVDVQSPTSPSAAPNTSTRRAQSAGGARAAASTPTSQPSAHTELLSPAAQLGRWLAANPRLQQLALFHCGINDRDVRLLLAGLIAPRNTNLHTLQLAWNPACTTRSAQMALQLVTELGNTTLTTVELETAAPVTAVRLEYACTREGVFRSGHTLIPADEDAEVPVTEADPVDLEQLRALQQELPTMPTRLTPARAARYENRCRFLSVDMDGTRLLAPFVTRELADVLQARPRPHTTPESGAAEARDAPELDGTTATKTSEVGQDGRAAPSPVISAPSPSVAYTEFTAASVAAAAAAASGAVVEADAAEADELDTVDDDAEGMQDAHQDGHLHAVIDLSAQDGTATADAAAVSTLTPSFTGLSPHPPGGDRRPRTSPPLHLQRDRLVSMSSRSSRASRTSSAAAYHRFHYKRQPSHNRSPQEMRDARFEAPLRIAGVMADAVAFRDRQHPHDRDTHAPPSAEVTRRNREHGGTGPVTPFYEPDAFVLRANGLTKVLVAPVRPGGGTLFRNIDLEDVPDRQLRACWCTPRQTSSMTGMFAGTLHYHCVHEGTAAAAQQQQQQQQRRGKSAAGGGAVRGGRASSPVGSLARHSLPVLRGKRAPGAKTRKSIDFATAAGSADHFSAAAAAGAAPADSAASAAAAASGGHTEGPEKVYRGCQGTGHGCLSRSVAAAEVANGYRGRMRATLHAMASRPATSSGSEPGSKEARAATAGSRRQPPHSDRTRAHFLDWTASDDDGADDATGGGGAAASAAAPPMKVRTVHTTSSGVSVSVNYNPMAHFSAPHVSAADGMTLAEF